MLVKGDPGDYHTAVYPVWCLIFSKRCKYRFPCFIIARHRKVLIACFLTQFSRKLRPNIYMQSLQCKPSPLKWIWWSKVGQNKTRYDVTRPLRVKFIVCVCYYWTGSLGIGLVYLYSISTNRPISERHMSDLYEQASKLHYFIHASIFLTHTCVNGMAQKCCRGWQIIGTQIWMFSWRIYMANPTDHHWFRQYLLAAQARSHELHQWWNIVNWTLRNKLQWNFNRNSNMFIQGNSLENVVCEMASILSQSRCVKS